MPLNFNYSQYKIAVAFGGDSSEREVSLKSGAGIIQALTDIGFQVLPFDIKTCVLPSGIKDADLVFPIFHGGFGENGDFQKLLEQAHIPFIGAGSSACHLLMDKIATKKFLLAHNLPTADFAIITRQELISAQKKGTIPSLPSNLKFPVVAKVSDGGSSLGVSLVKNQDQWAEALIKTAQFGDTILIETYLNGIECTAGIINDMALPLIELHFHGEFYDYDDKYTYKNGKTEYLCPPQNLTIAQQQHIQKLALEFMRLAQANDFSRVDFIIEKESSQPYILEANALPGFTQTSLVPKASAQIGWSYQDLCMRLVTNALSKYGLIKK